MANDATVKEFQQKIRDAQKENEDLTSKLAKKERECEVKMEEQVSVSVIIGGCAGHDGRTRCGAILAANTSIHWLR